MQLQTREFSCDNGSISRARPSVPWLFLNLSCSRTRSNSTNFLYEHPESEKAVKTFNVAIDLLLLPLPLPLHQKLVRCDYEMKFRKKQRWWPPTCHFTALSKSILCRSLQPKEFQFLEKFRSREKFYDFQQPIGAENVQSFIDFC